MELQYIATKSIIDINSQNSTLTYDAVFTMKIFYRLIYCKNNLRNKNDKK